MSAVRGKKRSSFRSRLWRAAFVCCVLIAVVWVVHPFVLDRALRWGLVQLASQSGLRLEVGKIHATFSSPFVLENIRLRAKDPVLSQTAANIEKVEISWKWPWQMVAGPQRLWREIRLDGVRGVFDFRREAPVISSAPPPKEEKERGEKNGQGLRFFPEAVEIRRATIELLGKSRSLYLQDASLTLSEKEMGKFQASGGEFHLGAVRQAFGALEAVTAWKGGAVYLADLPLREGVKIENFRLELARPDRVVLGLEAAIFGGSLRGDFAFGRATGQPGIEAALWATNIHLEPVPALLGLSGESDGVLREGRFTFRGVPERAAEAEASLRLVADGFRWNKRGWESLQIGASLIHRRLVISDLVLQQKDNEVKGNGEVSLVEGWAGLSKAPFLLNVSASINDLGALAGLFGAPFEEMTGRMSLASSISGRAGKVDGFLDLEASAMNFRKRPIDSARIGVTFANNEAQVTRCELWSAKDYLRAQGTLGMTAPFGYAGEMEAGAADVAGYVGLFRATNASAIYKGSLKAKWQGDGNFTSHSGAFDLALDNFISGKTPSGLTGRFAGTYSPQNIYFSALELADGPFRFFTRATLAKSGIKLSETAFRNGNRQLAAGEFFLPIDPFAVADGKPWRDAVDVDRAVYAAFNTSDELSVPDLLRLAGQEPCGRGSLRLNVQAEGLPAELAAHLRMEGRGLSRKLKDGFSSPSSVEVSLRSEKGAASLEGSLITENFPPATLTLQLPLGLMKADDGSRRWFNPAAPISGKLTLPQMNLAVFPLVLPKTFPLSGVLSGELFFAGTLEKPQIEGGLELTKGKIDFSLPVPADFQTKLWFHAGRAVFDKALGEMGGGTFELKGGVTFSNPANLQYDLALNAQKILLANDAGLKLRADADLIALGDNASGSLKGSVRLVDGRLARRLEITPMAADSSATRVAVALPSFGHLIPEAFSRWALDISLGNGNPFVVGDAFNAGEIVPDIRFQGTLGNPFPVGHVEIKNARVFLPFTTMVVDSGRVDFFENQPWMPQLNLRGFAQALDYKVQAYALGPWSERRLILLADPPLAQEALILLLTTGIAPGIYANAEFGSVGKISGGENGDVTALFRRLQFPHGTAMRGRFHLWEGLSLTGEGDDVGFSNAGATYQLRFR